MRIRHDPDPPPNSPAIPLPAPFLRLKFRCRRARQNCIKILIRIIFSIMRGAFQGRGQKFPLPSGTTPGAFDRGNPSPDRAPHLLEPFVPAPPTPNHALPVPRPTPPDH